MKTNLYIEFSDQQVCDRTLISQVKKIWSDSGNLSKDIKSINLYIKPEDHATYYVINDSFTGSIPL